MEIEFFEEDGGHTLTFSSEYADFTISVDPRTKNYRSEMSFKDDVYFRTENFEYRISTNPVRVETRLIDRLDEPPHNQYAVKDGVVLESELLAKEGGIVSKMTIDFIENLKQEIKWHDSEITEPVYFYLLSKHPEIISQDDFRRHLRQLSERTKMAIHKLEKAIELDNTGLRIIAGKYGKKVWYSEEQIVKVDEKTLKVLIEHATSFREKVFNEEAPDYIGISESEFGASVDFLKYIEVFLNPKPSRSKQRGFWKSLFR